MVYDRNYLRLDILNLIKYQYTRSEMARVLRVPEPEIHEAIDSMYSLGLIGYILTPKGSRILNARPK
jgi:hypothetical protein